MPFSCPAIAWHRTQLTGTDTQQSVVIALLRGLAALQVAAAHLRAEVFPSLRSLADPPLVYQGLAFITGFAHQAVVVFFLISGWLVGGSLLNRIGQPQAVQSYAIDRLTRLWTVLVPALLLMLLIGIVTEAASPAQPSFSRTDPYSWSSYLGNLIGLQTIAVPNFGGNYALWSLANETWYYAQFPLLLLACTARGPLRQAGYAAALLLVTAALPWAISLYFTLWLMGAAFSRVRIRASRTLQAVLLAVLLALSVYYRLTGSNDDLVPASFVQDLLCSLPFLLLLCTLNDPVAPGAMVWRRTRSIAHTLSECSFTLYVIHVPMIALLRHLARELHGTDRLAPDAAPDYLVYAGMLALILAAAYGWYRLFEAHTPRVRRKLKQLLLQPAKGGRRLPV